MHNRHAFVAGDTGTWRVTGMSTVRGEALPPCSHIAIGPADTQPTAGAAWVLLGTISNIRYATRPEIGMLKSRQEGLGRPQAHCAALIPIKKSAAWWDLAQDERRAIFEEQSKHTEIGLSYLPAVARQLYHSRDLGQPFDFLTWFEFAPADADAFEALVARLRATREWSYVEREIDVRLERHEVTA